MTIVAKVARSYTSADFLIPDKHVEIQVFGDRCAGIRLNDCFGLRRCLWHPRFRSV